ncbi:MAG TPA: phosphotransferase [Rubrobacteraceae bacterium]|nr:phosphotransferase [Rubrobacteraceae bacterium]
MDNGAQEVIGKIRPATAALGGAALERIRAVLALVPAFEGIPFEDVEIEPFDSFTNLAYKLTAHGDAYVLRVAGKGTSAYIDRSAEEHNARIATEAGLNAEVLFFDAKDGTMLSKFIEGRHMDGLEFHRDPTAVSRAALALKRLHGIGRPFRSRFGAFSPTDYYLGLLRGMRAPLPEIYERAHREAERVRWVLKAAPATTVPCHNDTCPENFVQVDSRVYLLDWEYSGMEDPARDLANLSVEAGFDRVRDRALLEAYCGGEAPASLYDRMVVQKAMSDFFWGLWSVVQHVNGNPAVDFWPYATQRFERCMALIASDGFGSHLDAVRAHGGS